MMVRYGMTVVFLLIAVISILAVLVMGCIEWVLGLASALLPMVISVQDDGPRR